VAKKKYSIPRTLFIVLLVIIGVANVIYYVTHYLTRPPHIKYPAFGIDIPPDYLIHGIDVSRYQHTINWDDVKEMQVKDIKIGFAFIKATEGTDRIDEQFERNWAAAAEAGIPKGAYHFFIAGRSGKAQAKNFTQMVKLKKGDLPPVLDIEETYNVPPEKIESELAEWLEQVEEYYHVKPIIYTNIGFYNTYLKTNFDQYPIWIAHYLQPNKPRIDHQWLFWQHSEKGRVNGIKVPVDFNVFAGDSIAFQKLLIQ
jgi:lysozyme